MPFRVPRARLCALHLVLAAAATGQAPASRPAAADAPLDLRCEVRVGDGALVTLERTVKGEIRVAGQRPTAFVFDEETTESWADRRVADGAGFQDRRVYVDSRSTLEGRVMDSGFAGMTVIFGRDHGRCDPDRTLTPARRRRLADGAAAAHLGFELPAEARFGESFKVAGAAALAATAFDLGRIREASSTAFPARRTPNPDVVRLEGELNVVAEATLGKATVELRHAFEVTIDVDCAARRVVEATLQGRGAPSGPRDAEGAATGEVLSTAVFTSRRIDPAWTPPPPTWRDNEHFWVGASFKLPSYWNVAPLDEAVDEDAKLKLVETRASPAPVIRFFTRDGGEGFPAGRIQEMLERLGVGAHVEETPSVFGRGLRYRSAAKPDGAQLFGVQWPDLGTRIFEITLSAPAGASGCDAAFDAFLKTFRRRE
ncbi:MAG TPA: hypothetical protein VEI02_06635 [Planctomycetota bacterium]|nr:hypothetical protein [Planctomycetota bacterium]